MITPTHSTASLLVLDNCLWFVSDPYVYIETGFTIIDDWLEIIIDRICMYPIICILNAYGLNCYTIHVHAMNNFKYTIVNPNIIKEPIYLK